jgi:hypothetical protein
MIVNGVAAAAFGAGATIGAITCWLLTRVFGVKQQTRSANLTISLLPDERGQFADGPVTYAAELLITLWPDEQERR